MAEDSYDRMRAQLGRSRDGSEATEIISRLYRLIVRVDRMLVDLYAKQGLTHGEAAGLLALVRGEERSFSPSRLASLVMCSTGAMTNRLDRLEANGLIVREPDPHDGRGTRIVITESGRKRIDAASAERDRLDADLIPGLSLGERQTLVALLRNVLAAYEVREDVPPDALAALFRNFA